MPRNNWLIFLTLATLLLFDIILNASTEAKASDMAEGSPKIELAAVCVDGLCGYVNSKGDWHIPPKFLAADPFSRAGFAWVITSDNWIKPDINDEDRAGQASIYTGRTHKIASPIFPNIEAETLTPYGGNFGLINTNGELRLFGRVERFFDGVAIAESFELNDKWGLINQAGQWLVEPKFDEIKIFRGDLFQVKLNGKWGLIDSKAQMILEARFDEIEGLSKDNLAKTRIADEWGLINSKGQMLIEPQFDEIGELVSLGRNILVAAEADGRWGLFSTDGKWAIAPQFDHLLKFSNQLAKAGINGQWGLISADGQWVIEPQLEDIISHHARSSHRAKANGQWGLLNSSGQWLIEPKFDEIIPNHDNASHEAKVNGLWGLVNSSGEWLIKPKFDEVIFNYSKGPYRVKANGQWGLINSSGEWIIKPQFDEFYFLGEDLAKVKVDDKWGIINEDGQWIAKPQFELISSSFADGLAEAKKDGKFGLVNTEGQWVVEPQFDNMFYAYIRVHKFVNSAHVASSLPKNRYAWNCNPGGFSYDTFEIGFHHVEKNGKWGLINSKGQLVLEPQLDKIGCHPKHQCNVDKDFCYQQLTPAKIGDKWGVINSKGQWLLKPDYDGIIRFEGNNLVSVYDIAKSGPESVAVRRFIDVNNGLYRTGLDDDTYDWDFDWELSAGIRILTNSRKEKVFTIEGPNMPETMNGIASEVPCRPWRFTMGSMF